MNGKPAKHLYVIGNGFDRYHGADSGSPVFYCMSGIYALRSVCGILRDAALALLGKV